MAQEIWVPVIGYEGYYEVSDLGRVRSIERTVTFTDGRKKIFPGMYLKEWRDEKRQNHKFALRKNGTVRTLITSRIVAFSFLKKDINDHSLMACHKDDNRNNNRLENLFIGTQSENMMDASNKFRLNPPNRHAEWKVELIRKKFNRKNINEIAKITGMSKSYINAIYRGEKRVYSTLKALNDRVK